MMSQPSRFAAMAALAAVLGAGALAWLFGLPWGQIAAFMIFTALLGVLCVVLLAYARRYPHSEASSSADDRLINASIAADIASSGSNSGGHDAGHHGM
jgi:hypothetical protein